VVELLLIDVGCAAADAHTATTCCYASSQEAQHLHSGNNATGTRTTACINSELNTWLAAESSETDILGIFFKNVKR